MSAQELQKTVSFSIKKEDVKAQSATELKKYAKTAKVQGFRPGKVPHNIVEQMYGGQAYEESLNKEINKQFAVIVIENKYNIIGQPKFDLTSSEGEEFIFSAVFEVMPEIKIGDLSTQTVEQPTCTVTDKHVQNAIDELLQQKVTFNEEDKNADDGDQVTIDFTGSIDGVEFAGGSASNYPFILGRGAMLPDFEDGIKGMKAAEIKDISVKFPDNYQAKDLAGKVAIFKITVKKVSKPQLPELNASLIQEIGVADGNEATMRSEIKKNLDNEIKRRLRVKLRENVLKALSTTSPITVPHALVHDEIHHMMHVTEENMKKQGYKPEQIKLTHDMFKHDATRMVTLRLLVQEYIKENKLTISDDEIKATVSEMAGMYDDAEGYIKWYYSDATRVNNARAITMENKVIDSILTKVKTTNVDANYEELMRQSI
jgi:trigger factor